MESTDSDSTVSNVRALKMYFQSKKMPIMGLTPINDHSSENNSNQTSLSKDSKTCPSTESLTDTRPVRPNRVIPRPPKPIQSSDINASPLIKVPPTLQSSDSNLLPNLQSSDTSVSTIPQSSDTNVPPTLQSERPIPKPRRSLQSNSNKKISDNCNKVISDMNTNSDNNVNNESFISDANNRSNSLTLSTIKQLKELNLNGRNVKSHSIDSLPQGLSSIAANDQKITCQTYNLEYTEVCTQTNHQIVMHSNCESADKMTKTDKQSSSKSKKHFKSFLKRSKLLSLRGKSAENSKKNKLKLCATNSDPSNTAQLKPVKPTRTPPLPPRLHFRPAAPLPPESSEDYYGDTLIANTGHSSYELYNDAGHSEQIYCSLDKDDESGSDFYEGINDYDDGGLTGDKHSYVTENYYEDAFDNMNSDCDRIYEVLPFERDIETDSDSNASTVSLDQIDREQTDCDDSDRKREQKAVKLRKKFNLTGEEIPVNAGIVKENRRGSRYDLLVRKGETVLILRMEGNPPGKWLAKNERAKVGFVDLANISFDAESVKCIIKSLASHKP